MRKGPKPRPMSERFWEKVDFSGDCWEWTASKYKNGYGQFSVRHAKADRAHRVAYRLQVGDIPRDLSVLHRCDNPACVRGDHLFLGSQQENLRDMDSKGRRVRPRSKLTVGDVLVIREFVDEGGKQRHIAQFLDIDPRQVNNIIKRRIWAHV